MYGITMGTLNVYIEEYNTKRKLVWTRSGDHGNKWQKEYIDYNPRTMYKVNNDDNVLMDTCIVFYFI